MKKFISITTLTLFILSIISTLFLSLETNAMYVEDKNDDKKNWYENSNDVEYEYIQNKMKNSKMSNMDKIKMFWSGTWMVNFWSWMINFWSWKFKMESWEHKEYMKNMSWSWKVNMWTWMYHIMGSWSLMPMMENLEWFSEFKDIMKSLEEKIKELKDSFDPSNIEETKLKIEELKKEFSEKVNWLDPHFQEMLTKRIEMFITNTTNVLNNTNFKEVKQNINNKVSNLKNNLIKKDLKTQYKEKFISQLNTKLDSFSKEKLEKILTKIETQREVISNNTKLTNSTKEKTLAQLDALSEIISEKLWRTNEIDINEFLNIE